MFTDRFTTAAHFIPTADAEVGREGRREGDGKEIGVSDDLGTRIGA